jgi:hypothetical protein
MWIRMGSPITNYVTLLLVVFKHEIYKYKNVEKSLLKTGALI